MYFLLAKIFISIGIVLGLVFVAEKVSARAAGLLAGIPLGTGIFVFFYSVEQGIPFVLKGIPYAIAGLAASMAVNVGFYLGGKLGQQQKFLNLLSAGTAGILAFLLIGYLIAISDVSLPEGVLVFIFGLICSILFFRHIPK